MLVIARDGSGGSTITRLLDLPNYISVAGAGRVGAALSRGRLDEQAAPRGSLADLLGA